MLVVHAHEESHPVAVPENVALDKLIVVSAVAHRSAFGTATLSFLLVSNSKSNSGPEEAIESLKNEKYDNSLHASFQIRKQNITECDNKFDGKNKTTSK
jgi:hypothetical protein